MRRSRRRPTRLTAESLDPLRTVLAAELVAAVRALRLRGVDPTDLDPAPIANAAQTSYDVLPADLADRSLSADLKLAASLLPGLAVTVRTVNATDE